MPLFYKQVIDNSTKLAIWKIEEEEDFFLKKVPLQRSITHPHKRLQHLAGRYLLAHLFPDFPLSLIQIADTLKPYLENEAYHFSISHSGDFAAAIVSQEKRVGVDVEGVTNKVQKVQHKFVSTYEAAIIHEFEKHQKVNQEFPNRLTYAILTLAWSCKEAVFKWYGRGEVDFKDHIVIQQIKEMQDATFQSVICFQKEEGQLLALYSQIFLVDQSSDFKTVTTNQKLVLSYVVT